MAILHALSISLNGIIATELNKASPLLNPPPVV